MRLDCRSAVAQSMSPAAWLGVAALVVLLGSLSFMLIGCDRVFGLVTVQGCPEGEVEVDDICVKRSANHYTCRCDCTGFGNTARIAPTALIDVYDDPTTQIVLGQSAPSNQGTIVGDSRRALLNGVDETWWFVNFDNGADGWVVQSQISIVVGASVFGKAMDVCVIPADNPNLGGEAPTERERADDCSGRVFDDFAAKTSGMLPAGAQCSCAVTVVATDWVADCDAACSDPVCLVAGSDPATPTPDPLSAALFAWTSVCHVIEGQGLVTEFTVGKEAPKTLPQVRGLMQIHGKPCQPGPDCQVGLSYQLSVDPIEFDSGTIFASDPKFVGITLSGATEPGAITITPLFNSGFVPAGSALTSVNARRSTSLDRIVAVLRNSQQATFAVNWATKSCRLSGPFGGRIVNDNGDVLDIVVEVAIDGVIVNQPPLANAGQETTLECTSPAGTPVTLDASQSVDPDGNIAYYIWRSGSDTGPLVGDPSASPLRHTTQTLGSKTYSVRVVDSELTSDAAAFTVNVVDTTKPVVSCNTPPDPISPPAAAIAFKATATDSCGAPQVAVSNVECLHTRPDGTLQPWNACKVIAQGDTLTIANTGGVDSVIRWKATATDGSGNSAEATCKVSVVSQGKK